MEDGPIRIIPVENSAFERFVIVDERRKQFWGGNEWTHLKSSAAVFADTAHAMRRALSLTIGRELRVFSVPITICLDSEHAEDITMEHLKDFLAVNSIQWVIECREEKVLNDQSVTMNVDWNDLEEWG